MDGNTDIKNEIEKSVTELYNSSPSGKGTKETVFAWFECLVRCSNYFDRVPDFMSKYVIPENYELIVDTCMNRLMEEKQENGKSDESKKLYRFLLEVFAMINSDRNYRDVKVRLNIAEIYRKLGECEKSIRMYRRLVYSNNSMEAAFRLVELYKERIDAFLEVVPSEAIKTQKDLLGLFRHMHQRIGAMKSVKEKPNERESRTCYYSRLVCEEAEYFRSIKEYNACYQLLNVAIDSDKSNGDLWNELGKLYEEQSIFYSVEKARESYEKAYTLLQNVRRNGVITKRIRLSIARTSLLMKDYDRVESICNRLLRNGKKNIQASNLLNRSQKLRKEETENVG